MEYGNMKSAHPSPQGPDLNGIGSLFEGLNSKALTIIVVVVLVLAGLTSSIYTVDTEEQGVVLRLGKFLKIVEPGLQFKLPLGIDEVYLVKTGRNMKEEFGYRSDGQAGGRSNYKKRGLEDESLCLTGDLNVCDIEWTVQFLIVDPYKYLFNVHLPISTIRDVSEASTRKIIGNTNVTDILTTERPILASKILVEMQKVLESYDIGVKIVSFNFQDVNPPESVKPAFNSVNAAEQQKESTIQNAQEQYNQQVPKARGMAQQMIQQAEGYALERVNMAQGEVQAFLAVLNEYQKSPEVTKKRLYIESMERILPKVQELYLVDNANGKSSVLPLLPLKTLEGAVQ
jgi:membrane protease subunit HflK